MLKWTVIARREAESKTDPLRRSVPNSGTSKETTTTPRQQAKRRRSSTNRRRSSAATSRRSSILNRSSLVLDENKENQFTSTPIKSFEDHHFDVLRDVGNLTPKEPNRRVLSASSKKLSPGRKKKKHCRDPSHSQDNFFRPFETVDSHIKGIDEVCGNCSKNLPVGSNLKRRIHDTYAPTLPTFATEYSPCPMRTTHCLTTLNKTSPLRQFLSVEDNCQPNKKAKIDHVNDFLHQISFITSPEDERRNFPNLKNEIKVSPLVRKFVDLRFSKLGNDKLNNKLEDSSYINDLSLDKIVDAILDSSTSDNENSDGKENNASIAVNFNPEQSLQHENDLNESQEQNFINTEHERRAAVNFNDQCSSDSGFRSSTTEISHQLDINFTCKCTKTDDICDKTIINIDETFNERCVDEVNTRKKRPAVSSDDDNSPKRFNLDKSDNNFTLKRQRCIRRRKTDEKKAAKPVMAAVENVLSPIESESAQLHDASFESNESVSTFKKDDNATFALSTPIPNNRRFRRCLLFESPTSLSESDGSSIGNDIRGSMDLNIHWENDELLINVIRCKDLYRPNGKQINAYVKVTLNDRMEDDRRKQNGILQRTAVQADSCKPYFNHKFKFPGQDPLIPKRIHIEVWHRDRTLRTSEFLGCMSFDARHAYKRDISGTYHLLPQTSSRCQNVPLTSTSTERELPSTTMCESNQSSTDDIMSLEDLDNDLKKTTSKTALSEQQKHADENLFLRYLELDPMEGPDAIPAALQRKATGNKFGRTPFTHTKKLTRAPKSGFGFSVVWTHPPRIERVEKGLPADKAGILPGDYIIFVDKHNVVMMPEIEILNLIRSYGSQLTLEIFRRNTSRNGSVPSVKRLNSTGTCSSTTGLALATNLVQRRPSTVCSTTNTTSIEYNRKKMLLPQVAFNAEKPTSNQEENRRKTALQLISKEQQYVTELQFAITRFASALAERRDLITASEHKALFQNYEEILRISEDILDNVVQEDEESQINFLIRSYHAKLNEISTVYKRYCSGIKKADCVLANKTNNSNSEFCRFIQKPSIPRRRPDLTTFIHKPLEHYREVLKLLTIIQSSTKSNHEDFPVINQIVHDLQKTYREITAEAGLMEPIGEGRPLLTVQDLENRLVFTKCKPFVLNKPGRQWIFGGDLGRVEGRNVKQHWTLLFSDLLLFTKVSRDRVLFVIEDPIPLVNVVDLFFNIRKKDTEFRIILLPGGRKATSPTVHCGPDLTRTPKKSASKRTVILRAPTVELKAVWQNLLQKQIFQINAGMDGSSFSSPIDSPDAPITSSVATLQSAESLSFRRQTPHNINENSKIQTQIDDLIEQKYEQVNIKTNSGKSNAIHLEHWMKDQWESNRASETELEPLSEEWTTDMLRKRSEELHLIDCQGNITYRSMPKRSESKTDDLFSDPDQSPSKSTTTESQITVRSSPLVPEAVSVCRQCHKNCLSNSNSTNKFQENSFKDKNDNKDENDWQPLLLMGLSAINPAASLVKLDPFQTPVPQISVAPPTPESSIKSTINKNLCNCQIRSENSKFSNEVSPDDSPQTEEPPYHSLSGSNLTLRRFGTVSSLERIDTEDNEDNWEENHQSSEEEQEVGFDNEAFYHSSLRSWTAKAGSFVVEKMAFFEKFGEDYRGSGKFFERYLKPSDDTVNGDDLQEDETSGATSGEEIWGTPTSGGDLDDPLNSPNYDGKHSPYNDSISSENEEDTELMMDELLMTPPISGAVMRGLLPRRTLEPLIEEDFLESSSSTSSTTPTGSMSPEQGKGTGVVADICLTAAENNTLSPVERTVSQKIAETENVIMPKIHRAESYRHIVEAANEIEDDVNLGFFNRFKPTVKFINIERVPKARSIKIFEFFNVRRERRIHQIPEGRQLIKLFSKEDAISDDVPTTYSEKPTSPKQPKDKQMDRRFWKQLSKRRGKLSNLSA